MDTKNSLKTVQYNAKEVTGKSGVVVPINLIASAMPGGPEDS